MRLPIAFAAAATAALLSGCATILSGSTQTIAVNSEPDGASTTITNAAGEKVHVGTTPFTVTLKRGAGYFRPETYKVTFEKPGFAPREIEISGTLNGWYIGNIVFGGLIGMIAVDPVTGAMFTLPDTVKGTLEAPKPATTSEGPVLRLVSYDALTPEQKAAARLLTAAR